MSLLFWNVSQNFPKAENLSAYDGLELRLKGDGLRYKLIVRTSQEWDTVGYTASFDTSPGQWQSVSKIIFVICFLIYFCAYINNIFVYL